MQTVRDIKKRIKSIRSTQRVMDAMKMVAAAKLRRSQAEARRVASYANSIHKIAKKVSRRLGNESPNLWRRRFVNKLDVLTLTSNTGLCGEFNENLVLRLKNEISTFNRHNIEINVFTLGDKATRYFSKTALHLGSMSTDEEIEIKATNLMIERYLTNQSDGAMLIFNRLKHAAAQELVIWDILPLHWRGKGIARGEGYIYEPNRENILETIANKAIRHTIKQALLESHAAELSSRMLAMDNASRNADKMIEDLNAEYNRTRQAEITSELIDIIKGSDFAKTQR